MRLRNKVAIITGGANGIGRASAVILAREGAQVVIADRDSRAGEECAALIAAQGGRAWAVATDLTSDFQVESLVEATLAQAGGLDILVNSAGVAIPGSVVDTEPDRWHRVLDVNLASAYRTCRAAIPAMIQRGGGAIVNIASLQGMYGWPGYAAYAASKAGIIGFTRQIAVEYAPHNIRANAISPGGIATQLGANSARLEPRYVRVPAPPASPPAAAEARPRLLGPGQPEDVAWAVLFLASDEAGYISGHNLVVDGINSARVGA